jgi:hypothetical protein
MFHKEVRMSWVTIWIGWATAFAVWGIGWVADNDHLGQLAILIAGIAATASVREFFIEHDESVRNIIAVLRLGETDGDDEGKRLRRLR